jgi:catechol 2,3-dioxygenase-like lactoylglutathione lyase family enzyme
MLSGARYSAALPCRDLARARSFYADKLGLVPADEHPDRLVYEGHSGTEFLLFASSGTPSGSHDQMRFSVTDIQVEVRELKRRGVRFEEYDFPGFDKATSIAWVTDHHVAWFKDSEGNQLAIVEMPAGAIDRPDTWPAS